MARLRGKGGLTSPLNSYRLEDGWWQRADTGTSRPSIGGATGPRDVPVVIKQWHRQKNVEDSVLREIWHDEVRQLSRLKGLPRASEYLATIRDSFEDAAAFTLVLNCGDRIPLSQRLLSGSERGWLSAPRSLSGRIRLWAEVRRLALAIGILHGQGLLHRNIDSSAVMTGSESEPDFLLTGFEWSMRLASSAGRPRSRSGSTTQSFYEDWRSLGHLIAEILGVRSVSGRGEPYRADVGNGLDFLSGPERDMLRTLIAADPLRRLDADVVSEQLDLISPMLEQQRQGADPKLVLALRLDAHGELSKGLRRLSGMTVRQDDFEAQIRFVREALGERPALVRTRDRDGTERYQLTCARFALALRPVSVARGGDTTWSVAECRMLHDELPAAVQIDGSASLEGWELDVTDVPDAKRRLPRLQGKTTKWDAVIRPPVEDPLAAAVSRSLPYAGAMLVQVVDMLWRATQIWPVHRLALEHDGATARLTLEGREDPVLSALSTALDIPPPAARMFRAMSEETIRIDGEWQAIAEPTLGRVRSGATTWNFVKMEKDDQGTRYLFQSPVARSGVQLEQDLYVRIGAAGEDAQTERRLAALRHLRDHSELLAMIADPTEGRSPSRDDPAAVEGLRTKLDASKFEALVGAWENLPLYLVQGPPGVGKTKLVQGLVGSRLAASPMDRMLLSAQSHSAVDHLLEGVSAELEAFSDDQRRRLLPLRCRALEAEAKTDWDREVQAARISASLAKSTLVAESSPALRRGAVDLARRYAPKSEGSKASFIDDDDDDGNAPKRVDRSFEHLLLRSANLVFATTNSSDLARLLEQNGHFDWVVLEEAGKATGVELLAPMMLSHRRMLIGDHKQLPAFDADQLRSILGDPAKVRAAIDAGAAIIAPLFRKLEMEEALETLREVVDERLCAEAVGMLSLFETLVVPHVVDRPVDAPTPAIGRQLLEQHRMHPVLGGMISDVFYEGKVETSAMARTRFEERGPIVSDGSSILPDLPFVFVDMPYVRSVMNTPTPERRPGWSNPREAAIVVKVLSEFGASAGADPSLAVLSPYRRQVKLLQDLIVRDEGASAALRRFTSPLPHWVGTVDSFQGNEADVVVVSLVRNNAFAGRKALGFLADERRMNVLLSRAKWRLVVIGSIEFLQAASDVRTAVQGGPDLGFIRRFLDIVAPVGRERPVGVGVVDGRIFEGGAR
jgi:hypothetical protein